MDQGEEGELFSSSSDSSDGGDLGLTRFVQSKSEKWHDILCANGFEYQFEADSKLTPNVEYWKCIKVGPQDNLFLNII